MLTVTHVTKRYPGQDADAVAGVSFVAQPGEFVALMGPSGCGKSSFVRAGLLPQLATHVESVYVEATPDDTEGQLLKRLQRHLPDLPIDVARRALPILRAGIRRPMENRAG